MRLDKFVAQAAQITRSEARKGIRAGAVTVEGTVCTRAETDVAETAAVTWEGRPLAYAGRYVYLMLDKPKGVVSASEDGRDVTLYRLFGGEVCILSASCVMDSVNIDLYIDAEEDTEAYCISAGVFRRLMQQNVHVRCYAYQMTAERFSDSMWTMQQVLFMSADRRLAIFLTDELAKTGGDEVRMTHDQMAKYMGSAREVVSRMLKYFAQEGWVRLFRGGVQVLDRKKLQQLARGE